MSTAMDEAAAEQVRRYEKSLDCIHCGLCLTTCPTYQQTGNEVASPRGRIYLMRGLAEGRLDLTDNFREQMELCLMCRACETACPSSVQFGAMMEITRHEMHGKPAGSALGRALQRFFLRRVVPSRRWLSVLATAARLHRITGLAALVRATRLDHLLPATLRAMSDNLPDVPAARERRPPAPQHAPAAGTTPRGRVALLSGCVASQLFPEVNRRTIEALCAQGFEVVVPEHQTCCGALHAHAGDMDTARELARRNIDVFDEAAADHVVLNSAGCGAAMKEYASWLEGDAAQPRAEALSEKVIDVLELFDEQGLTPRGDPVLAGRTACYDAPCHLHHAQRCATAPTRVLARVEGLDLVPLPGAETCCGAAGIYNLTHPDMSRRILDDKLDQLEKTGAQILLTGNPGCLMQWRKGISRRKLDVEVRHPAELL